MPLAFSSPNFNINLDERVFFPMDGILDPSPRPISVQSSFSWAISTHVDSNSMHSDPDYVFSQNCSQNLPTDPSQPHFLSPLTSIAGFPAQHSPMPSCFHEREWSHHSPAPERESSLEKMKGELESIFQDWRQKEKSLEGHVEPGKPTQGKMAVGRVGKRKIAEKRVKKDAIWKQIIRDFRHYFQQLFIQGYGKGIDHWKNDRLVAEVQDFIHTISLDLPYASRKDAKTQKDMMALLMFLRTTIHKKPPSELRKHVPELIPTFQLIFTNNNKGLLKQFFKTELVARLWDLYPLHHKMKVLGKLNEKEVKLLKRDFQSFDLKWPLD